MPLGCDDLPILSGCLAARAGQECTVCDRRRDNGQPFDVGSHLTKSRSVGGDVWRAQVSRGRTCSRLSSAGALGDGVRELGIGIIRLRG